jgi:hypothetical protein
LNPFSSIFNKIFVGRTIKSIKRDLSLGSVKFVAAFYGSINRCCCFLMLKKFEDEQPIGRPPKMRNKRKKA